jgi:hypothetical protein
LHWVLVGQIFLERNLAVFVVGAEQAAIGELSAESKRQLQVDEPPALASRFQS